MVQQLRPIVVRDIDTDAVDVSRDRGEMPRLGWVRIEDLVVDDSYQRGLTDKSWRKIRSIAEKFHWSLFTAVDIAPAGGGKYAIIDGQHRTHAAALCGVEKVPCRVIIADRVVQARAFAAINGDVMNVTVWQIYKAALVAGEQWAIASRDLVAAAGCRLMEYNKPSHQKKPGEVYAVNFVREWATAGEARRRAFIAALSSLLSSSSGNAAANWTNTPLSAWVGAVYVSDIEDEDRLRAVLNSIDMGELYECARQAVAARRRAGQPTCSTADELREVLVDALCDGASGRGTA